MKRRIELVLPECHPAQAVIDANLRRFNVLCCGRRFGKDIYTMNKLVEPALEKQPVAWGAPTYKMLSDNWRDMKGKLFPVISGVSEQEKQIRLIGGGVVDFWSLDDPDKVRGRKYKRFVMNEAAMVKNLMDVWNMVIRPTLVDLRGDAFFPSTPKGLNGYFTLWSQAGDRPDWSRHHYTTYDNPYIPRDEIDALKISLPERVFKQEILAEFIEDGSYFQNIDAAAVVEHPDTPEQHAGHTLVGATDWAIHQDYTVNGIACRECNRVVDWDRFNQIEFIYQRERLYAMDARWKPIGWLPERNSIGEPNIELIRHRVLVFNGPDGKPGFNTLPSTKPALIQGLASAIEHFGFKVPIQAADELRAYEVEAMPSGHPKFGAPEGQHDDWVMMLALLWQALTGFSITGGIHA